MALCIPMGGRVYLYDLTNSSVVADLGLLLFAPAVQRVQTTYQLLRRMSLEMFHPRIEQSYKFFLHQCHRLVAAYKVAYL